MAETDESARRSWHFMQLKRALQALAIPGLDQRKLFPDWVQKADELALDFADSALVVRGNYRRELSSDQLESLDVVDRKLLAMSGPVTNSTRSCGLKQR